MSKILILTDEVKRLAMTIPADDRYILSDKITDASYDVICVSHGTRVSPDDISAVANLLESRSAVVGCSLKKSSIKSIIYRLFGISHGENNCGIVGIPSDYVEKIAPTSETRTVRLIRAAEENKIPICDLPMSKSSVRRGFLEFIADLFSLFLVSQPLKFLFSAGMAFIIDYILLLVLNGQLYAINSVGSMEISALIAWCVSSLTNFFLNRYFVFKATTPFWPSFAEYYGLAGAVFVLKTYVLLEVLTRVLHINLPIAKLICEIVFFVSNYFIQKKLIFKRKKPASGESAE